MNDKLLFDTNIICYSFDLSEPEKRAVCKVFIEKVINGEILGVVSNQILGEIFNVTIKMNVPLDEAKIIVKGLINSDKWEKINYTEATINRTIEVFKKSGTPFWDLLIAETMKENGIAGIITENERDFSKISGIKVINPFRPS